MEAKVRLRKQPHRNGADELREESHKDKGRGGGPSPGKRQGRAEREEAQDRSGAERATPPFPLAGRSAAHTYFAKKHFFVRTCRNTLASSLPGKRACRALELAKVAKN